MNLCYDDKVKIDTYLDFLDPVPDFPGPQTVPAGPPLTKGIQVCMSSFICSLLAFGYTTLRVLAENRGFLFVLCLESSLFIYE